MSNTTQVQQNDPSAETAWQKTVRKATEEPAVPVGMRRSTMGWATCIHRTISDYPAHLFYRSVPILSFHNALHAL